MEVNPLLRNSPCVDAGGRPLQNLFIIIEQLRQLTVLSGSGSPEGIVTAGKLRLYMDDITGEIYIKKLEAIGGDRSNGWVQV